MRRIVMLVLLSSLLASCGFGGPSAADYAVKACNAISGLPGGTATFSAAMAARDIATLMNAAADQAAHAAAKDDTWKQLGKAPSDMASEWGSIAGLTYVRPSDWTPDVSKQTAPYLILQKEQLSVVEAECRRARAS